MKRDEQRFNILYVDDEADNLASFLATFRRDYNVYTARSGQEGLDVLRQVDIHLIITDQRMPEMTGVQFLESISAEYPEAVRMILTGFTDMDAIIKAINSGRVFRYITKPWDARELKQNIDIALQHYRLEKTNKELVSKIQQEIEQQKRILNLFKKYVPENIIEETLNLAEESSILSGESRIISVLFCDIRDFTKLSVHLDAATLVKFLNHYFSVMSECIMKHNGTVNKFLGDGILAIFGAPYSFLNNQHNAVLCGLEMVEKVSEINEAYQETLGRAIEIGIGIDTGETVVGNIGSSERVEYTAIGKTVNYAFKIEALTHGKPNSLLISETTYLSVKNLFVADKVDATVNLGESINVYQVKGKK